MGREPDNMSGKTWSGITYPGPSAKYVIPNESEESAFSLPFSWFPLFLPFVITPFQLYFSTATPYESSVIDPSTGLPKIKSVHGPGMGMVLIWSVWLMTNVSV